MARATEKDTHDGLRGTYSGQQIAENFEEEVAEEEHSGLGTDYGIRSGPTPRGGMRMLISSLLDLDFTADEIHTM
ncbi:MAG: hypothetical protein ABWY45_01390 [Mycobacterium sp.]